jgi:toxin YoeB
MHNIIWTPTAWEEYLSWQTEDRKTLRRINDLIKDIRRNGLQKGIGKPEALRHFPAWSRRIDAANRLVYSADAQKNIVIFSCRGHYEG